MKQIRNKRNLMQTDLLNGCHDYMLHRFLQSHYDLDIF